MCAPKVVYCKSGASKALTGDWLLLSTAFGLSNDLCLEPERVHLTMCFRATASARALDRARNGYNCNISQGEHAKLFHKISFSLKFRAF